MQIFRIKGILLVKHSITDDDMENFVDEDFILIDEHLLFKL